jgi:hypothetical protein
MVIKGDLEHAARSQSSPFLLEVTIKSGFCVAACTTCKQFGQDICPQRWREPWRSPNHGLDVFHSVTLGFGASLYPLGPAGPAGGLYAWRQERRELQGAL